MPNEFLLVLHDGDPPESFDDLTNGIDGKRSRRDKGAYYKNIERKMLLKKKRANVSPHPQKSTVKLTSIH